MTEEKRHELLNDYAVTSRAFSDAVEQLRHVDSDVEAFIGALAEAGTAHRKCERSRIKLEKYLTLTLTANASDRPPSPDHISLPARCSHPV